MFWGSLPIFWSLQFFLIEMVIWPSWDPGGRANAHDHGVPHRERQPPGEWGKDTNFGDKYIINHQYQSPRLIRYDKIDHLYENYWKLLYFEWSPPRHFKTACWHNFCLKLLSRHFGPTNYPNHLFHLAGHCVCQPVKQDINMSLGHVK